MKKVAIVILGLIILPIAVLTVNKNQVLDVEQRFAVNEIYSSNIPVDAPVALFSNIGGFFNKVLNYFFNYSVDTQILKSENVYQLTLYKPNYAVAGLEINVGRYGKLLTDLTVYSIDMPSDFGYSGSYVLGVNKNVWSHTENPIMYDGDIAYWYNSNWKHYGDRYKTEYIEFVTHYADALIGRILYTNSGGPVAFIYSYQIVSRPITVSSSDTTMNYRIHNFPNVFEVVYIEYGLQLTIVVQE